MIRENYLKNEGKKHYLNENGEFVLRPACGQTASLLFAGDFCPINRVSAISINNNKLFSGIASIIREKDLFIANLECPLTKSTDFRVKVGPHLKADPHMAQLLVSAGVDVVTLSNNHIMDYEAAGLTETIGRCKDINIQVLGAGASLEEAAKIMYCKIHGISIALLNFSEIEFSTANATAAGTNPLNLAINYHYLSLARKTADIVIVIIHGGIEHFEFPPPFLRDIFYFFADAGADAVIGHHTHCTSPFEIYHDVPLIYSLGNFIFDWPGELFAGWYYGMMASLEFDTDGFVSLKIIPFEQCTNDFIGVRRLGKGKQITFFQEMNAKQDILWGDQYLNVWNEFIRKNYSSVLKRILHPNKITRILHKIGIRSIEGALNEKNALLLLNSYRCDSHRSITLAVLETFLKGELNASWYSQRS